MKYHFIILSLIAFVCIQGQTVLLTPILPASAFENEFYQVRFRVRNLVGARFEFKNVPSFFTASSEGLLSGVPTKKGLYAIEVIYFNDTFKDSKEVIIDVRRGTKLTNYNTDIETQQSSTVENQLKPKQQYLFTYNQNDELHIQVNVTNGMAPFNFQPIYIPLELQFNNKTGRISGALRKYGDYIIGINVKDATNHKIQILIKITIVIRNTTTPRFIFYQRSMLQVNFQVKKSSVNPPHTLPSVDSKNQVSNPTIPGGSVNIIQKDQQKLPTPQTPSHSQVPSQISQNQSEVNNQIDAQESQATSSNQSSIPSIPQKIPSSQPVIPESAAQSNILTPQIISTQNIMNKNITTDTNMQSIQRQKESLNRKLQLSKNQLKGCYQNVQIARNTVQNLLNTYNEQFNKVDNLKNQLQELTTRSRKTSLDLEQKIAKLKTHEIQRMLAERQFNRSQMSFDNVNFAYNGSVANINKNNEDILAKQSEIDSYKRGLDNSYKIIDQAIALNSKLEEKKSQINEDIKKGMGLFSRINSTKVNNFGGCQNYKFYQKSLGVGQVKKVMDKIYLLTNNHFITYGDCSESDTARPGDIIEWKGYLMNGVVSALSIKKLK